ncbi:glucose-6-phosphate dehydrogenase [Bacillus sp. AFS017336]|uniref:glucose-6-phosphate dehydrogenase n=1 Tax=Bacillus sp. AFS017336 TaxID=2033489 RepID=UPI000BF1F1C1|nr:glucose-6-phosphate dehydrogenase [Bacillus sp. AFS017336]PEL13056.1 glucose-6-phosphate dehydrogenase [Bacillus sp. AFS017336]
MDSMSFVLFGATGDLAKRKIFPALYNLYIDDKMPDAFSIIGIGRKDFSHDEFQNQVKESLITFSRRSIEDQKMVQKFLDSIRYQKLDITNKEGFVELLDLVKEREMELNIPENRLFYLSVAPEFFDVIASNVKESGLGTTNGWKRLIIEKPFGRDLKTARELNEKLSKSFKEEEVYRIDHYLGKPMVQNLEALEFANPVLQALWNNQYIANVQITASETVGVEERAGYYDKSGAIRDMFQNHMLQMLMMSAMHLSNQNTASDVRAEKKKVLESLRPLLKEEVASHVVRGQYGSGELNGKKVVAYKQEPGIEFSSQNDTFVAARVLIENDFWKGIPFYIRTGKRMKEKSTRIVFEFKSPIQNLSNKNSSNNGPNLLVIEINPNERVSFYLNSKNVEGKIEPVQAQYFANKEAHPEAYELLVNDALRGDSKFFAHWNEVELSWQWVQPILEAFEENLVPLQTYKAGSFGPKAADELLAEDGFKWWLDTDFIEKQDKDSDLKRSI